MTELLEKAVEAVRRMPAADQDTIAQAILSMTKIGVGDEIDPEHLQDVLDALADVERGEFATNEEVAAAFRSFERRSSSSRGERRSGCVRSPPTSTSGILAPPSTSAVRSRMPSLSWPPIPRMDG